MPLDLPGDGDAHPEVVPFEREYRYVAITLVDPDDVARCDRCHAALAAGEYLHIWVRSRRSPRPRIRTGVTLCSLCHDASIAPEGFDFGH